VVEFVPDRFEILSVTLGPKVGHWASIFQYRSTT
jgi:hypothetical protein